MPRSEDDSPTEQIRKLKAMLEQNEVVTGEMRKLIAELEEKTRTSKDKKRRND